MPILDPNSQNPTVDGRQSERALQIQSGVCRYFSRLGLAMMPEFTLTTGRRADLIGIDKKGQIIIVEIKSSIEDFKADNKWPEYKQFCDRFYFATLLDVPEEIFPQTEGMIIADQYGGDILREAEELKLSPATRKALTIRLARAAAKRLDRVTHYRLTTNGALPDDLQNSDID